MSDWDLDQILFSGCKYAIVEAHQDDRMADNSPYSMTREIFGWPINQGKGEFLTVNLISDTGNLALYSHSDRQIFDIMSIIRNTFTLLHEIPHKPEEVMYGFSLWEYKKNTEREENDAATAGV